MEKVRKKNHVNFVELNRYWEGVDMQSSEINVMRLLRKFYFTDVHKKIDL